MATTLMNPIDAAFLAGETDSNLMHVGGLQLYRLPDGEDQHEFITHVMTHFRGFPSPKAPFNRRPHQGLTRLLPRWDVVDEVDMEIHLQHHALPKPGTQRELGILVSRLHSIRMDRSRPLWEVHLIEGLDDDRIAVYAKMHHSVVDGVGAMRLALRMLSRDPEARGREPMWASRRRSRAGVAAEDAKPGPGDTSDESITDRAADLTTTAMRQVVGSVQAQASGLGALARMYTGIDVTRRERTTTDLAKPFSAPKSILNKPITSNRRVSTLSLPMDGVREIAKLGGGTVNDVVLAVCAGGLRRYLAELGELPDEALVAGVPMSFRPADSDGTDGNATTMALASLATHLADPTERFAAITASTTEAKEHMRRMPRAAIMNYSAALMTPFAVGLVTGTSSRTRPMFNMVISNVPGPEETLFLEGATLEDWYPLSIPLSGYGLNITIVTYGGSMHFCFTACGTTLPHGQRLAPYCKDAFDELAEALA